MSLKLRVIAIDLFASPCVARLPFKFGAVTMDRADSLLLRVEVEGERGGRAVGHAADLMVPKWFDKNPDTSVRDDALALSGSVLAARAVALDGGGTCASVFDHWWRIYEARVQSLPFDASDRLVRGFGVALVERALIDAACRLAGQSFFEALRANLLGFEPGRIVPELAGWSLASVLPQRPRTTVDVRHTVGMLDALTASDLAPESRVDDGLPQSLDEDIDAHGLRLFKIKIGRGPQADSERLFELAKLFEKRGLEARFTLDGNEQYDDLEALLDLFARVRDEPIGERFLDGLIYIEQPIHRAATFDTARNARLAELSGVAPVIIDEADCGLEAFPRAIELGYRGVSMKNCKGVFRALIHRGLCAVRGRGLFLAAEDLTNLGVVALQQDLATIAALGLEHVERNGHHYFRGLAHLPDSEVAAALRVHGDLYTPFAGGARLAIAGGRLAIASLEQVGYGYAIDIDRNAACRIPIERWKSRS